MTSSRVNKSKKPTIANTSRSGVFITATDTGLGKTTVVAALAIALQHMDIHVGVMKPIETGVTNVRSKNSDSCRLGAVVAPLQTPEQICLYSLAAPLAPLAAARIAGTPINLTRIVSCWKDFAKRYDLTLIEGVGGVMVPLSSTDTLRDLIHDLHLPCIVIARTTLGTVNHVLLTIEALRLRRIVIAAIVLNENSPVSTLKQDQTQRESSIELIKELSDAPVIGPLSYVTDFEEDWEKGVHNLALTPPIQNLARLLTRSIA